MKNLMNVCIIILDEYRLLFSDKIQECGALSMRFLFDANNLQAVKSTPLSLLDATFESTLVSFKVVISNIKSAETLQSTCELSVDDMFLNKRFSKIEAATKNLSDLHWYSSVYIDREGSFEKVVDDDYRSIEGNNQRSKS